MSHFEYKTIMLNQKRLHLFTTARDVPNLEVTLNCEAEEGWRLQQILSPSAAFGESHNVILVLERQANAPS